MLEFAIKLSSEETEKASIYAECFLTLEQRVKARQRVTLSNDESAALFIKRGSVLRDGDCVQAESGEIITIRAEKESVSTAEFDDAHLMARACYHLGNRHVSMQIDKRSIRYLHDHVLDDLLKGLGVETQHQQLPFQPEAGAYGDHGHASAHSHEGSHSHGHSHSHSHNHDTGHEHHH